VSVAALELGGSHVAAGRVDLAAGTVARRHVALPTQSSRDQLLERIRAVAAVAAGAQRLGVAAPGPFDYTTGVSLLRHKLAALYGVDLRSELASALGVAPAAIRFLNDADAFLLGEWLTGAARGADRVLGVTLGTGLGSAFLADGVLASGVELYRSSFRGRPVEDTISARGIGGSVSVAKLAASARSGDEAARDAFERAGDDLGEFLLPHVRRLRAEGVVVGGSIARAWDLLAPALRARVPEAVGAANLETAALVGAAYHAA
jgi:glucokinase